MASLLEEIGAKRASSGLLPLDGAALRVAEALEAGVELGARRGRLVEALAAFKGAAADDELLSLRCAERLIRWVLADALLAYDAEWLQAEAHACAGLKGQALHDHLGKLEARVRGLASVVRYRDDRARGYTNAEAAETRAERWAWGTAASSLLAGTRGTAQELLAVPAAEIVHLLLGARLYELVVAEESAADSDPSLVPWDAPAPKQLLDANARIAPFLEREAQVASGLVDFVCEELLQLGGG